MSKPLSPPRSAAGAAGAGAGAGANVGSKTVKVVGYNVLAQCLAQSSYFPYCKGTTLKWKARFPRLADVLTAADADVLCLSEVDNIEAYEQWLRKHQYDFVYCARPGRKYGNMIAWRAARFQLQISAACNLNDLAACLDDIAPSPAHGATEVTQLPSWAYPPADVTLPPTEAAMSPSSTFLRSCVGVVVALRFKSAPESPLVPALVPAATPAEPCPTEGIVVGCTHLFWAPWGENVRAAQTAAMQLCMADVAAATMWLNEDTPVRAGEGIAAHQPYAVFFSGDLNTIPGTLSYRVMNHSPLPVHCSPALAGLADVLPTARNLTLKTQAARAIQQWNMFVDRDVDGLREWRARLTAWVSEALLAADASVSPGNHAHSLRSAYAVARAKSLPGADWPLRGAESEVEVDDVLAAACDASRVARLEPPFTTYTADFVETLDYVYFQPQAASEHASAVRLGDVELRNSVKAELRDIIPLPSVASIRAGGNLAAPSLDHPSDHFAVGATFELS